MRSSFRSIVVLALLAAVLLAPSPAAATPSEGLVKVPEEATLTLLGGDPQDRLGSSVSRAGDLDADGRPDLLVAERSEWSMSSAWALRGGLTGVVALTSPDVPPAAGFGLRSIGLYHPAAAGVGDVNGDGRPDLAIASQVGGSKVVYGRAGTRPTVDLDKVAPPAGFAVSKDISVDVAPAGDFNGDGLADTAFVRPGMAAEDCMTFGYPGCIPTEAKPPALVVVFGRSDRTAPVDLAAPALPDAIAFPITLTSGWIRIAAAGDTNGDGRGDLLVGLPSAAGGDGRAIVLLGAATPTSFTIDPDALPQSRGFVLRTPAGEQGALGDAVGSAGDVNGDGRADLLIGAPKRQQGRGGAWIVYGRPLAGETELTVEGFGLGQVVLGPVAAGRFGSAVDGVGDINGDQRPDLVVGAPGIASAFVLRSLAAPGIIPMAAPGEPLPPASGFVIRGSAEDKELGAKVAGLGAGRIAVAAPAGGGAAAGAVHVVSAVASRQPISPLRLSVKLTAKVLQVGKPASFAVRTSGDAAVGVRIYRVENRRSCPPVPVGVPRTCSAVLTPLGTGQSLLARRATGARTVRAVPRAGGKALAKGRYVAVLRATAGSRRSPLVTTTFRVR